MRINDFHNILELVKQDILQSEAEYLKLLKVVGNNQRYDFRSQLSIYDRNPEATACAKFDYWRERFNRTVMRGQKGIPTKLKMLEANYKSNRYRLEDKVAKNYPEEIARTEKLIEAVKRDISEVEPKAEGEEKFNSITIAGEKIIDKKLAGERLLEAISKVKINKARL